MHDVVICEPLRTPVGRYGGALSNVTAVELAATVIRALIDRTGIRASDVDDVILGQCYPNGEAPAIGRVACLDAGFPVQVPGLQVDRRCGSGLQSVLDAAMRIQTGAAQLVIAGGVESMSQAEHYAVGLRWGGVHRSTELIDRIGRARITAGGMNHPVPKGMLETAENLRVDYRISRQQQDELAAESHRRAIVAQETGKFNDEIVPVTVRGRPDEQTIVQSDEHPRRDTGLEQLGRLRPVLVDVDPSSTVTAGNSSGQNDGASACLVMSKEKAQTLGLRPLGRLVSWGLAAVRPDRMGIGPVPATAVALQRASLSLNDIDLIELNEAFAAQVLAVAKEWNFGQTDFDRMNVNGSGISLGHPVGATGTRILTTLLRELSRRSGRYGLETMCIGGGQGLAAIFERV